MKALVLCGGLPQIALMEDLKSRGITVVLADMNEKVAGRAHADIFYPVSALDVEAVKELAVKEQVDFLLTVCADQVLQVVAEVSEALSLPCYIDFETAQNVSKKSCMKRIFVQNGVPTSKYVILETLDYDKLSHLVYPLIVKPVDAYSSRGVKRVNTPQELPAAFEDAVTVSRTNTAVVEEFVTGDELSADIYIEGGAAHVLCVSKLDKIGENGRFVIYRGTYPADISPQVYDLIQDTAQKIAAGFHLTDTPMLIQMITDGERISVVEFCARTGGGVKFRLIKRATGFDVVKAVADLTLGQKPHVELVPGKQKYIINEFLYCNSGVFDHLEGLAELLEEGVIAEYSQYKAAGTEIGEIRSSGDRVGFFTVEADDAETLQRNHRLACRRVKALDANGLDILKRELLEK